jgi:hypothetical protein
MWVKEIWRYPVKSMAGEQQQSARLTSSGIEGDRVVQVQNARGRIVTARTYPRLLGFHATLDGNGNPLIDGRPWTGVTGRNSGWERELLRWRYEYRQSAVEWLGDRDTDRIPDHWRAHPHGVLRRHQ